MRSSFYNLAKPNCRFLSMTLFLFFCTGFAQAQTANSQNYIFSTTGTGSLQDMSAGTTQLIGPNAITAATALVDVGFDFWFMGERYTQFSVNTKGLVSLGALAPTSTESLGAVGSNKRYICALSYNTAVGSNGKVHYKISGVAPNRVLTIEWKNMLLGVTATLGDATYQVSLSETSGAITLAYGHVVLRAASPASINYFKAGFQSDYSDNLFASVNVQDHTVRTTDSLGAFHMGSNVPYTTPVSSETDGNRRIYTFESTTPAAPSDLLFSNVTQTVMGLGWTDHASNELGYAIYQSTDGVHYNYVARLPPNTTAYSATGLSYGTTYYWHIRAISEGALSMPVAGSSMTLAGTITGIKTVGLGGDYTNLTAAFADINVHGLAGATELQLIAGYPATAETYPIQTCGATVMSGFSLKMYPTVPGLSITSQHAQGTLLLNNVENLLIDGRVNQTGQADLVISNNGSFTSPSALEFRNSSRFNAVRYCVLRSNNQLGTSGTIVFGASTSGTGNDHNQIDHCLIGDWDVTPTNAIYSAPTVSLVYYNSENEVSSCEIFNYFNASMASSGIFLGTGNDAWMISGNRFYQTGTRYTTITTVHTAMMLSTPNTGGHQVLGNVIGYADGAGTGVTSYTGGTRFVGIHVRTSGTASVCQIQGNTVTGLSLMNGYELSEVGMPGVFSGIYVAAGNAAIGTDAANVIGASGGSGAIILNTPAENILNSYWGIACGGGNVMHIENNIVGAVRLLTTGRLTGIQAAVVHVAKITNNRVTDNTVQDKYAYFCGLSSNARYDTITGNVVSNNEISGTTGWSSSQMYGILTGGAKLGDNIAGNAVHDLTISGATAMTGNQMYGIYVTGNSISTPGVLRTCKDNVIHGLHFETSEETGSCLVTGINNPNASTLDSFAIYRNRIYDLSAAGSSSSVSGVTLQSGKVAHLYNNLIGDLRAPAGHNASSETIRGISLPGGLGMADVHNNTVLLQATSSGGVFSTTALYTTSYRRLLLCNNILINNSVPNGTGKAVAFRRSAATLENYMSGSNNNLFYAGVPDDAHLLLYDGSDGCQTINALHTLLQTCDVASRTEQTTFLSADGNSPLFLHVDGSVPSFAESGGMPLATSGLDYDLDIRQGHAGYTGAGTAPDIGADEFEGSVVVCSGTPEPRIAGAITICRGTSTELAVFDEEAGTGISYQWSAAETADGVYADLGTESVQSTGNLVAGMYYKVTATCASSGLTAVSPTYHLQLYASPLLTVGQSASTYCTPDDLILLSAINGGICTWSPAAGLSATNTASVIAKPEVTTTYTVTSRDHYGCIFTALATVNVGAQLQVVATASQTSLCLGGSTQLEAIANSSASYDVTAIPFALQTDPTVGTSAGLVEGDDVVSALQTLPFSFKLYGKNFSQLRIHTNGYLELRSEPAFDNNSPWQPQLLPSQIALPNIIAGVYTDLLTLPDSRISTFTTGVAPHRIYTVYYDNLSYINTSVPSTVSFQVQLYETTNIIEVHLKEVTGGIFPEQLFKTTGIQNNSKQLGASPPGRNLAVWSVLPNSPESWRFTPTPVPVTYSWTPGDFLSDGNIANPLVSNVSTSTTYSVIVQEAHGCTATATATIAAGIPLGLTTQVTPANAVCVGLDARLRAHVSFGGMPYTYSWVGPNGFSSTEADPLLRAVTADMAGTYTVTVSDECGTTLSSAVELIVQSNPVVNAGPDVTVCYGESITLAATGAVNYAWSVNVANNASIPVYNDGIYVVRGTDANGCRNKDTFNLTVLSLPALSTVASTTTVCPGDSVVLSATANHPFTWNNGVQNGVSFVPVETTIYTVTTTDGVCTKRAHIQVTVYPRPNLDLYADTLRVCEGESIQLLAYSSISVFWNGGTYGNGQILYPEETGFYIASCHNGFCMNSDTMHVIVNVLQGVSAGPDLMVCPGMPVTLTASPSGIPSWNHGVQDGIPFIPESTATYNLILQVGSCAAADEVMVTVLAPPQATVSSPDGLTAVAGPSGQVYQWVNCGDGALVAGANLVVFTPGDAGTYAVIVTSQDGCSDTSACLNFTELGIGDPSSTLPVALYPNPTNGNVTLSIGAIPQADVTVFDAQGKVISKLKHIQDGATIDLGAFETGVYVIRVATDQGIHITRILKN